MKRLYLILFPALLLFVDISPVMANPDQYLLRREAILDEVFRKNAREFGLPFELVKAISRQESDCHPLMINVNGKDYRPRSVEEALRICEAASLAGAQYDVGIMQINRYWIRKYSIPHKLLLSPSDNIYMGCFILANEIKKGGMNWRSIGKYHSHTPWRRDAYAMKIKKHLINIVMETPRAEPERGVHGILQAVKVARDAKGK